MYVDLDIDIDVCVHVDLDIDIDVCVHEDLDIDLHTHTSAQAVRQ